MVIPTAQRRLMLAALHEGHPGIAAMQSLAQFYSWWPKMDQDINNWVKECQTCQENHGQEPENIPERPWEHVHVDFVFILADAYYKWTEVVQLKDMTIVPGSSSSNSVGSPETRPKEQDGDQGVEVYHDANVRACSFRQGDEVWVKNECKPGWHPGVVERRTGKLSYKVLISGQIKQKHADQIHSRSGAMEGKPTLTVANQQQEVEVQESQLPEQQLIEQDLRPRPKLETQSLRKKQYEEGPPVDPMEATPNTIENGQKSQPSPNKSIKQEPVLRRSIRSSRPPTMDLTNNLNEENPQNLIE
ncbi:hypothetical protein J437_LFUL008445, partial [Ladona fulva]